MNRLTLIAVAIVVCLPMVRAKAQRPCQAPALQKNSSQPNMFTDEQESDLGDAIAEHIQHGYRVIEDEELTSNLTRIGQRIMKHLPENNLRFQFLLVDLPEANAFVLPGGRVYVSRKLAVLAQSEDELAGIIGHEIGHLLARQGSIRMTRWMREVLGVKQVTDKRDIFDKYNQLMDNIARMSKALVRDAGKQEDNQQVADQIGLFAVAGAGYDPQGLANFFDRITENKGRTGSFFSELFGNTKPESKRVREMIKAVAAMPPSCVDKRGASTAGDFQHWQAAVLNYTGLGRRESIHSVLKKTALSPPLRAEVNHLRFSPDGKYVLAQDDSSVNVLSVDPFELVFRFDAPEAKPAQFTPDSQNVVIFTAGLRVETWSIAEQNLKEAHELSVHKGCWQSLLSPDGKTLACLDGEFNLNLLDTTTGAQVFQKKDFYTPGEIAVFFFRIKDILNPDEASDSEYQWINMGFSADARYFAAAARGSSRTAFGGSSDPPSVAVDLTTHAPIPLPGGLKRLLGVSFAFVGADRLIGINRSDPQKSAMVSFPGGESLDQLPLGRNDIAVPTLGNYLLLRPIKDYPLGVMDLSTKKITLANKQAAFDIYDKLFVSERTNGEVALYTADKRELKAKTILPRNPLGRLRAVALSSDLNWLAVSERTRGAVWNLAKGERAYLMRGFRGGYFSDDAALYADFPKLDKDPRAIARLDLTKRDVAAGAEVTEDSATQYGSVIVVTKPAKKDGGLKENVTIEARDVRTNSPLWIAEFPKEAPRVFGNAIEPAMVLLWSLSSGMAQAEIKGDPQLANQLAAIKEKEGGYFLKILDARTGKPMGRLLIETGKGSFRISGAYAFADWLAILDTQNRVQVYSLSTGQPKGKVFGGKAILSSVSKLMCVENEKGRLTIYDLTSMEQRDQFVFSSPVSLARFSSDGKSLFVLTASQIAYVLDVSSLVR